MKNIPIIDLRSCLLIIAIIIGIILLSLALHKHFFEMSNDLLKALKNRKNSL